MITLLVVNVFEKKITRKAKDSFYIPFNIHSNSLSSTCHQSGKTFNIMPMDLEINSEIDNYLL